MTIKNLFLERKALPKEEIPVIFVESGAHVY